MSFQSFFLSRETAMVANRQNFLLAEILFIDLLFFKFHSRFNYAWDNTRGVWISVVELNSGNFCEWVGHATGTLSFLLCLGWQIVHCKLLIFLFTNSYCEQVWGIRGITEFLIIILLISNTNIGFKKSPQFFTRGNTGWQRLWGKERI